MQFTFTYEIKYPEAFHILAKSLHMDFVLEIETKNFEVRIDEKDDTKKIFLNGEVYDDRGELFEALVVVAKCIFPGL